MVAKQPLGLSMDPAAARSAGYRRCMPARKPPTAQDAATARRILLDGLAHDVDMVEILHRLAPLHPRNNTFPGEVLLRLAADALDWAGVDRAHPLDLAGMRERFLPECNLTGRDRRKLQFAVMAAAVSMSTCSMRSPGGRATTSGATPHGQRSPTSA